MSFWWVMQGQTFDVASSGGFLWCPGPDRRQVPHWIALERVEPGDVIFSYVGKAIVAVVIPKTRFYTAARPTGYPIKLGATGPGRKVDAKYQRLKKPIPLEALPEELRRRLTVAGGPLQITRRSDGSEKIGGKQGYLYPIVSYADARDIVALMNSTDSALIDSAIALHPKESR